VADRLRTEILAGLLPPGNRLLQTAVAQRMRTSTTPVREALRELAAEGLLDGDPHRGFVVHNPTQEELAELYELRMLLEPASIAKTAERIGPEELAAAERLLDAMDGEENSARWAILNRDFHALLAAASGRPLTTAVLSNLRDRASVYVALSLHGSRERLRASNSQHREILRACRARDAERAREVTVAHLHTTVDEARPHLGPRGG
jgi:DNA-binding GntR family transcriptional regulator